MPTLALVPFLPTRARGARRRSRPHHFGDAAARRRLRFLASLGLALVCALAAIGGAQFLLLSDRLEERLVADGARGHEADALSIATAAESATGEENRIAEIAAVLEQIAARPGVEEASVVERSGVVVASSSASEVGRRRAVGEPLGVALTGKTYAGPEPEHEGDDFSFVSPLYLPTGRFAFEVNRKRSVIAAELVDLREDVLLLVALGLLVGAPAFYLFGGRQVSRLHRDAIGATRDSLTGLGNHRAFQEEIARAFSLARRYDRPLALAMLDLDDFKFANDSRGHRHGDWLLTGVAAVLSGSRLGDRAFRVGGDEFAVILPETDAAGARAALERIRAGAEAIGVKVSGGIAALDLETREAEIFWEQADAALREAKRNGGDAVVDFADVEGSIVTVDKVRAVRRLIAERSVGVALQPIWDLARDAVIGYEALARPTNADQLPGGPGEAFEVAARIGHAHELDAVCRAAALGRAHELNDDAVLFVNVAPQTLERGLLGDGSLLREVRAAGLEPAQIVLEVTEQQTGRITSVVNEAERLRAAGFRLALDDVGAGNAGLEMLRRLTVDFVKIDRGIVARAPDDDGARAVLAAIVAFACHGDSFVIAEGIETEEILSFLRDGALLPPEQLPGVHGGQGYLLGRPCQAPLDAGQPQAQPA